MLRWFRNICRPVTDRLEANYVGYFRDFRVLVVVICLAATGDLVTTIMFMMKDGVDMEVHPAIRIASIVLGPVVGPLLGKAFQLLAIFVVTVYWRRGAKYVFIAATMMYAWAAWYNVWGRYIYEPILSRWLPL